VCFALILKIHTCNLLVHWSGNLWPSCAVVADKDLSKWIVNDKFLFLGKTFHWQVSPTYHKGIHTPIKTALQLFTAFSVYSILTLPSKSNVFGQHRRSSRITCKLGGTKHWQWTYHLTRNRYVWRIERGSNGMDVCSPLWLTSSTFTNKIKLKLFWCLF